MRLPKTFPKELRRGCAVSLVALAFGQAALAQDRVPVRFEPGTSGAIINGAVVGDGHVDYILGAREGQTLVASLAVTDTNGHGTIYFNIIPAGQDFPAIYNGSMDDDNRAEVVLPETGDWAIRVYLMGNDRDTGKTVGFSMDVSIPPSS